MLQAGRAQLLKGQGFQSNTSSVDLVLISGKNDKTVMGIESLARRCIPLLRERGKPARALTKAVFKEKH